jgi:hypothetical protein
VAIVCPALFNVDGRRHAFLVALRYSDALEMSLSSVMQLSSEDKGSDRSILMFNAGGVSSPQPF